MKRKVTLPWNAAAWRHRNPQPEYHHVAPIGEKKPAGDGFLIDGKCNPTSCHGCGYHVCSCERAVFIELPPDSPVRGKIIPW